MHQKWMGTKMAMKDATHFLWLTNLCSFCHFSVLLLLSLTSQCGCTSTCTHYNHPNLGPKCFFKVLIPQFHLGIFQTFLFTDSEEFYLIHNDYVIVRSFRRFRTRWEPKKSVIEMNFELGKYRQQ